MYFVPFVEDEHTGLPEDDHPESEGHKAVILGEESDDED